MVKAVSFLNRNYDETVELLVEARNYVAYRLKQEEARLDRNVRLAVSHESLRITARLTHVMAWLLTQKAVQAGEITVEQSMGDDYAFDGGNMCLAENGEGADDLPPGLRSLLDRSLVLYERIQRLDAQNRERLSQAG